MDRGRGSKVFRSGEKGRTASLWLVGESRFLYVRTKGNIAEALSYNLLMYRGGTYREKGFYLSKYIYGKIWNSSLAVYE